MVDACEGRSHRPKGVNERDADDAAEITNVG
jgi:hypothetical protein